jgi:hypothetical protein
MQQKGSKGGGRATGDGGRGGGAGDMRVRLLDEGL